MKRSQFIPVLLALPLTLLMSCEKSAAPVGADHPKTAKKLTIAFLPKSKGNSYFIACEKGAREAVQELGAELLFDGPTNTDPAKQNEIVENWMTLGVDVIAVACENREGSLDRSNERKKRASRSSHSTAIQRRMRVLFL